MTSRLRSVICPCGGDVYEPGFWFEPETTPIWRCCNCGAETPRRRVNRKTNKLRAIEAYLELRKAWHETDAKLDALVAAGKAASGAFLVHSSAFNWHLKQLTDKEKPSNFDVRYHAAQAKADLEKAVAFCREKEGL